MGIDRILDLKSLLAKKSFFLFGPRATGKSTLVHSQLSDSATIIDLLDSRLFLRLSAAPQDLEAIIDVKDSGLIVIDEIQRVPELLNEVHRLIEKRKIRFLLTGSSARKLKRGQANLLAGRVWEARMFPLTWKEAPGFNLEKYLRYGGLPAVYLSEFPEEELDAYVNTYLKEEIMAEGLVRNLPPFARFLRSMAMANGEVINFTKLASDCQVAASTVREHVALLEDTLVGFLLPAWAESKKRKAIKSGKFYFFDPGVTHTLAGTRVLDRNSDLYGKSFEQFIGMEIRAYLSYNRTKLPLTYWRSTHGHEVDFLVAERTAVEVKATARVVPGDFKGLKALAEEQVFSDLFLVSQDAVATRQGKIRAIHWEDFLKRLWQGEIIPAK
jgi:predicted AAA+ superfamily ATPase